MFRYNYFLVVLISYFVVESEAAATGASFIKPCKSQDKACLISSSQAAVPYFIKGIPELGVPSVDPMTISSIRNDEANLKLGFKDITVTGVSKCKILDVERDTKENTVKLVAECPIHGTGQYDLNGKIFLIEAFGEGEFQIHTDKVKLEIEIKFKDIVKDGEKYWKIIGFDYKYDLLDKVHIVLKNLFNGDKERAKPLEDIFENSGNELVEEIGGPMIRQLLFQYLDVFKIFFLASPKKQLEIA